MLDKLSDQIRECYQRAVEAKAKADATNDPALKTDFLKIERRWLVLARSYGFTESLENFTTENSEWRSRFDERLRANMESTLEASLADSAEQILWSIVENSDDAIITINLDGIISSWNRSSERLYGYSSGDVIGKSVTTRAARRRIRDSCAYQGNVSIITKPFAGARMVAWSIFR
jgi:PAS domain-containing protein